MPYWRIDSFILNDPLNAEVWVQSPHLQHHIQPPEVLAAVGSIGPQQAMLEDHPDLGIGRGDVLPWVPDLVGKEWKSPEAVFVYGAAYAGFIREYSTRHASMPIAEYREAAKLGTLGVGLFQNGFLRRVVEPDNDYYGRIAILLEAVGIASEKLVLSDLCPLSLVKRFVKGGRRADDSRQPTGERAAAFQQYVEHPFVRGWTARRIKDSQSCRIVALGWLAEHGLLRLLHSLGAEIGCQGESWNPTPNPVAQPWAWVNNYAQEGRRLWFWLNRRTWWTVSMMGREWRLLPIYHPASVCKRDSGYGRTTVALRQFLRGAD